ncbi:MAG: hypothetical protein Q4F95_15960 [Oscillospiraceae bacterium]|nr:hypothetical protein [Oscillospiraceae bacterium]
MGFERWQIIYRCSFILCIVFFLITAVCVYRFRIISVIKYRLSVRNEQDAAILPAYTPGTETSAGHAQSTVSTDVSDSRSGTIITHESSGTVILSAKELYSDFKVVTNILVFSADKDKLIR